VNHVQRTLVIERPPDVVFALISDPSRYPEFFAGITRWEPKSRKRRGPGARYRVLMRVGSIEAGGLIAVERWVQNRLIEWRSERGVRQRGRWMLSPADGKTTVTLELEYDLSGGPMGWLVEWMAASIVGRNMLATLLAARRILEHDAEERPQRTKSRGRKRQDGGR
jgi:ribosome-associated toxin RatA of RatAB toxin-antitoxin module